MDFDIACRAVLFDSDGVLVDSTDSGERSWTRWAGEYGLDPALVLDGVHGRRSKETVALFLPPDLHDGALARIETIEVESAADTVAIPGAARLLDTLPGNRAIVTSASPALLGARLAAAGLPLGSVVVTADDVHAGKPAPDGYLRAADRLGVPIGECVVFEDSVAGILAGQAAGAGHVVGVGPGALDTDVETVVRNLEGITWLGDALRFPPETLLRS
jgi:sugar-phosphatase